MPSVGSQNFDTLTGRPLVPAVAVRPLERDGVDGADIFRAGLRERETPLRGVVTAADDSAADAIVDACRELVGQIVAVTIGTTEYYPVLVVDAVPSVRACLSPTTTASHTRLVDVRFQVRLRHDTWVAGS